MTYAHIIVERDGPTATITLNRPDAMNALTPEILGEMHAALSGIAEDSDINVVVVTGAGRAFCAGVDLKALQAKGHDISQGNVGDDLNNAAQAVLERIEAMPLSDVSAPGTY